MATRTDGRDASSDEDSKKSNTFILLPKYPELTEDLAFILNVYMTPILVVLGIIGNVLSVIVFFKVKLQGQSTSQYLSALAISDTVFLLQLIPAWLKTVKASIVFAQNGFCQMFTYLTYVSCSLSSWLVVSFTVERFVAVLYPLRRTRLCTIKRARLLILLITACCLTINIPVLIFVVPSGNDCNIDDDLMDHAARFNMVDTIFSFSLPLAVITVLNVLIMIGVCRQERARGRLLSHEAKLQEERTGGGIHRVRGRRAHLTRLNLAKPVRSMHQRITKTLLVVSSVFVILNLPAYTMRIVAYANNMSSHEYTGRLAAIQQICLQFFNVNFGINFLLYCMTGQNFRRALCQSFPCLGHTWKIVKRLCCWKTEEHSSPVRPVTTRSFTTHKEARTAAAAYEESLSANMERPMRAEEGRLRDDVNDSLEMYSFDNPRQQQQRVQYTLPLERVHMFNSGQLHRPVPRVPLERHAFPPATPASDKGPSTMYATSTFRPIPYHLIPGQIAPLRANSPTSTPSYEPSPSPSPRALSARQSCDDFGHFIHPNDPDFPALTTGIDPYLSPSPHALSTWQSCDGFGRIIQPNNPDFPALTAGIDPYPSPLPHALSAWQSCDGFGRVIQPNNPDLPALTAGIDPYQSPLPHALSAWQSCDGFGRVIQPNNPDFPAFTTGIDPYPSPSPHALSAWQNFDGFGRIIQPNNPNFPALTAGIDPYPPPSPHALSAWQGCDRFGRFIHPNDRDYTALGLRAGTHPYRSPSPQALSPWQQGSEGFGMIIRPDNCVRPCPRKYKKRVSFTPVHGPVPLARRPSASARARARSQPQLVNTRGLSPMVYSPRRCATTPSSQRTSDATRHGNVSAFRPVKQRTRRSPSYYI